MVVRRRQQKSLKLLRGGAKDSGRWGSLLVGCGSASPSLERERKQVVDLMSGGRCICRSKLESLACRLVCIR